MSLLSQSVRLMTMAAVALSLTACIEEDRESVDSFEVLQSFTVKNIEGGSHTFRKGDQDYGWDVVLGSDDNGQRGVVLQKRDQSVSIPLSLGPKVSEYFRLDGSHDVSAAQSGQNVSLEFTSNGSRDASTEPSTSIENCTVTSSERVCERQADGKEKCVDRTITRSGQRSVTRSTSGSYDYRVLILRNSKKQTLARIEYSVNNTRNHRDEGICY